MIVMGLASCDTCRKAKKALAEAGRTVTFRDIRSDPLSPDEAAALSDRFGDALINRRSTTWRGLSEAERAAPSTTLLAANPALMKRPVIDDDGTWHLGWGPEVRAALGLTG